MAICMATQLELAGDSKESIWVVMFIIRKHFSANVSAGTRPLKRPQGAREREFFIDNLLVGIHFIIVMIRWTGLAPWELESPVPGNLTSTFLDNLTRFLATLAAESCRGSRILRNPHPPTQNPKPSTPNPKPQTLNPRP